MPAELYMRETTKIPLKTLCDLSLIQITFKQ